MTKVAIFLMGAGATGKTTTRNTFCQGDGKEISKMGKFIKKRMPNRGATIEQKYSIVQYDNCVLVGNKNSGTDSITTPSLVRTGFFDALELSDTVIIDGVMSTSRWVEMVNEYRHKEDIKVVVVHYDFAVEKIRERLSLRRKNAGIVEERLPDLTFNNVQVFTDRAKMCVGYFLDLCRAPVTLVKVDFEDSPEQVVQKLQQGIKECLSTAPSL
jgi:hypothetical protein